MISFDLVSIGKLLENHDTPTFEHSARCSQYAEFYSDVLGLDTEIRGDFITGAFLHDVGKLSIKSDILSKPERLSSEEFLYVQQHIYYGAETLSDAPLSNRVLDIVMHHHERYDGNGYGIGMRGSEIPFLVRLFSLIDVFDALTSDRPYKKTLPLDESLSIILDGKGVYFDPQLTDAFIDSASEAYSHIHTNTHPAIAAYSTAITSNVAA